MAARAQLPWAFETRLRDTSRALALFVDSELDTGMTAVRALASSPLLELDDLAAFGPGREASVKRLVAGGWWLVAGGWWLVAGGWVVVNDVALGYQQVVNTSLPDNAPLPSPAPPGEGASQIIGRVVETERPAASDLFVGRATGRATIAVAAPSFQGGRVSRVVVLGIDPARLSGRLREQLLQRGEIVSIADSQGRIVARSQDHERFLGTVPPSRGVQEHHRERSVFRSQTVYGEPGLFAVERLRFSPGWSLVVSRAPT